MVYKYSGDSVKKYGSISHNKARRVNEVIYHGCTFGRHFSSSWLSWCIVCLLFVDKWSGFWVYDLYVFFAADLSALIMSNVYLCL